MIRLNKIQKKAVETTDSHLLVMAGAGSGKTRVITSKIIHLIKNKGVPPYAILAITFTNKAADEMKTRVKEVLSSTDMRHLQVRTFHSFGAMLLRSFISHLPPYDSRFTIIDPGDQKKIIKSLAEKAVKTAQINFILQLISSWKNDFLYPDAPFKSFAMYDTGSKEPGYYREWYKKYQDHLLKNNLLDFDDLIALPVQLSQKNSACNDYLKSRWRYVLVDEYQDTNTCQEKIIRLFYQNGATITAVGDDDQSIYSFRGADITNIRCFENNYKKSSVIQLEQNYRSTQSILDAANDVIAHNRRKYQKKLFTRNETGEYPSFTFYYSDREEAAETALEILKANDRGCAFAQTAVFYRTNYQSRLLEENLIQKKIPYQIIGGYKFFERKEIKDIISYLNVLANKRDSLSLQRIINFPPRGIGKKTVTRLINFAADRQLTLMQAFSQSRSCKLLPAKTQRKIDKFSELINKLEKDMQRHSLVGFMKLLLQKTMLFPFYQQLPDKNEANERCENIFQLLEAAGEFAENNKTNSLPQFLEHISLHTAQDEMAQQDTVKLMTVHNAKGLEFDTVFVTGMEENTFPHILSIDDPDETEEERRLFYVAMTRARKNLFLSGAGERKQYGRSKYLFPSRFIREIDRNHFKYYNDISRIDNKENMEDYFVIDQHEYF